MKRYFWALLWPVLGAAIGIYDGNIPAALWAVLTGWYAFMYVKLDAFNDHVLELLDDARHLTSLAIEQYKANHDL